MAANIVLCTVLTWVLTAVAVAPLASMLFRKALMGNGVLVADGGQGSSVTRGLIEHHNKLYTKKFVEADVIVMALAGFIAGLAGFALVGFAWKAKAWPGLLALIASSFIGCHLAGRPGAF
jgi:hypothetical protein